MAESKWLTLHRYDTICNIQIEIAAGDRQWFDNGLTGIFNSWCSHFSPFQLIGLNKGELLHGFIDH